MVDLFGNSGSQTSAEDDELEKELQTLIAQATQETIEEHHRSTGSSKFPWTDATAAEFRHLLDTDEGVMQLICDPYFLGLKDYVYESVLDDLVALFRERRSRVVNLVIFIEGIGSGKCVSEDTLINSEHGLIPIRELGPDIPAGGSTLSNCRLWSDVGPVEADTFFNSGIQDGIELTTRCGRKLTGTKEHPVLTKDRGWVKLEELTTQDRVAVVLGGLHGSDSTLNLAEAYLAGFLLGDGHLQYLPKTGSKKTWKTRNTSPSFRFTVAKKDEAFYQELKTLIDDLGIPSKNLQDKRRGNYITQISWDRLWDLPELCSSNNKKVPSAILQAPASVQRAFIAGWLDADGSVNKRGDVQITQVDRDNISTLQLILGGLGIFSSLRLKKTSWQNGRGIAWRLKIGPHAYKLAGFPLLCDRKREKIRHGELVGPSPFESQGTIVWSPVEALASVKGVQFYDFHVPTYHRFTSNGLLSHNTTKFSILQWLQWFELATTGQDPQAHFDLIPGSTIALINLSRTEQQARRVCFSEVWKRFQCPFIQDYFTPNPRYTKEINIPQNNTLIFAGTSSALSALGYNLYGGGVDEAAFLEIVDDSKKAGVQDRYDAAEEMHNAIFDRMTSRFQKSGIIPGMLVMFSSPRYPDDFLERKCRQAEELGDDSGIFWRRRATWSAKGKKFYPSGEFFYVDTDTMEEVPEEKAMTSGELLFLDNDSLPPKVATGLASGELISRQTERGLNVMKAAGKAPTPPETPAEKLVETLKEASNGASGSD